MRKIKQLFLLASALTAYILLMSAQPSKSWDIPAKYKTMPNSVKPTEESINAGLTLYRKNCAMCHGKTGLGDGPKSKTIETSSGDLTTADFQSQTDGIIFYKSKFGKGEMTSYENKIDDEDIWNLVNYMRTLKK